MTIFNGWGSNAKEDIDSSRDFETEDEIKGSNKDKEADSEEAFDDEASSEVIVEEVIVLRYDLCDIVFANIVVSDYEYNYIEFNTDNSTYYLENKYKPNGIVAQQSGEYEIDGNGNLTITNDDNAAQNYFLYVGETAQFIDDELNVEAEIPGYGSVSLTYQVQQ